MADLKQYANGPGQIAFIPREVVREAVEEMERLQSAIRWALGYDEGPPDFSDEHGPGAFSWRKELRRRAALAAKEE